MDEQTKETATRVVARYWCGARLVGTTARDVMEVA